MLRLIIELYTYDVFKFSIIVAEHTIYISTFIYVHSTLN